MYGGSTEMDSAEIKTSVLAAVVLSTWLASPEDVPRGIFRGSGLVLRYLRVLGLGMAWGCGCTYTDHHQPSPDLGCMERGPRGAALLSAWQACPSLIMMEGFPLSHSTALCC